MKFRERIKEDSGNGILILGIMLIIAGLLIGGMMLDLAKSYQLKASYINAAKKATQVGIMKQDTRGGLTQYAAAEAVKVYENITRPSIVKEEGFFSACKDQHGKQINPILTITFKEENQKGEDVVYTINRKDVKSTDTTLDILNKMSGTNKLPNYKHTGLELKVTETTPNVILPSAFKITKADDNNVSDIKCQKLNIKVGSSTFIGSNSQYE